MKKDKKEYGHLRAYKSDKEGVMQKDSITEDKWTMARMRQSTKDKLAKIKTLRKVSNPKETVNDVLNHLADNYINQKGL